MCGPCSGLPHCRVQSGPEALNRERIFKKTNRVCGGRACADPYWPQKNAADPEPRNFSAAWLEVQLVGTYWPLQGPDRGDVNPRLPLWRGSAMQWTIGTTPTRDFTRS